MKRAKVRDYRKSLRAVLALFILCAVWLSGCGKSGDKENAEGQDKTQGETHGVIKSGEKGDFVYVPETSTLDTGGLIPLVADVYEDVIYFIGQRTEEETQKPASYLCHVKPGETKAVTVPLKSGDGADISVTDMCMKPDGNLYLLVGRYPSGDGESGEKDVDNVAGTDQEAPPASELWTVDTGGKILSTVSLQTAPNQGPAAVFRYMETDGDGNLYVANFKKITVYSPEGAELFDIPINGIGAMGRNGDGAVIISSTDESGMRIRPVDLEEKKLGEPYPGLSFGYSMLQFAGGQENGSAFLISSDNKVYVYDTASETASELFNWLDMNVNSDAIRFFFQTSDGAIAALTSEAQEAGQETVQLALLTKTKASEAPQKKTLILGTMQAWGELKELVTEFNKTSTDYRIEVREYMQDSYEDGRLRMKADIVGGDCPDIVDLGVGSAKQYMAKGVLEDLNPWLDQDPEINREDYLENVLNSCQMDGKLYGLFPAFYIDTIVARASDMGGKTGWTLDEMIEYVENRPEGAKVFQFESCEDILIYIIRMNLERFVDWNIGECRFENEDFIRLLEFSAQFPPQEEVRFVYGGEESLTELLQEKKVLLLNTNIGNVQDYQTFTLMYGEPVTFIGYPTETGQGSEILAGSPLLGMSAKSQNKEGVWQFLRSYLTKEYQEAIDQDTRPGFPIMKSALEAVFQAAMTPEYYEDENGNQAEKPKNMGEYSIYDAEVGEIYAAKQEDVDAVKNLLESVEQLAEYDLEMNAIILEEAGAFFRGQKPAEEVARIIQNRVQIYVNENR